MRRRGFSLVEVIAVIVILGLIGSATSSLILTAVASYTDSSVRQALHGEASVALDRLVREIREIDADPEQGPPQVAIRSAAVTWLQWGESSSLRLDGNLLVLNTDGAHEDALCTDVSDFTLDFLDGSNRSLLRGGGVADVDLPRIQRIALRLSLTRQGMTETLNTRVFIRASMAGESP